MVEEEWLEMVDEEVRDFCRGSFLEDAPLIHVSSTTGEGIDDVKNLLDDIVSKHRFEEVFGPFRLPVDRVFAMKGFGAVITGTSISGRVALGEELQIYPGKNSAKVRGIQVHSQAVTVVEAGHRTAINLQGIETLEIERGMTAATPGALQPSFMLDCSLTYLSSNSKALKHRARVRVHLGTAEVMGRVSLLERDELQPGEEAGVQLLLEEPVAVWPHDRYVIRSYSPVITIGGGEVLGNVSLRKRKRLTDRDRTRNVEVFQTLKKGSQEDHILLNLEESGNKGLVFDELAIRLGVFGKQLKKILNEPLSTKKIVVVDSSTQRYLARSVAEKIIDSILLILTAFHKNNPLQSGLSKEGLRSETGRRLDQKVFSYCLNELIRNETIIQEESLVRLAGHEVALKADEEELQGDLLRWYREKGLTTATLKETSERFGEYPPNLLKEVLNLLLREEKLVKVSESLYYDREVMDTLKDKVVAYMETEGEIDAPRFKDMSGLTRKFSIPILEYFDRIKLTYRIEDRRILRKKSS
jgi:selenocysteine-specific elongation factor